MSNKPNSDNMAAPKHDLRAELGLSQPAHTHFYRDNVFLVAIAAGFGVTAALRILLPEDARQNVPPGLFIIFIWLVWSPLLEELLFRGVIQGQLSRFWNSGRNLLGLSYANWVTSLVFAGFHFIHHPPLWAVAVLLPSLIFGYLRDRYASILPSIVMHSIYNAQFLLLLG